MHSFYSPFLDLGTRISSSAQCFFFSPAHASTSRHVLNSAAQNDNPLRRGTKASHLGSFKDEEVEEGGDEEEEEA